MLNQYVAVGRIANDIEAIECENERKKVILTIAIPRPFKNADGMYETDFIDCLLWDGIAGNVCEYCKKGDIVGVKGRLQTEQIENEDGTTRKATEVIAEKVTFLSSKTEKE